MNIYGTKRILSTIFTNVLPGKMYLHIVTLLAYHHRRPALSPTAQPHRQTFLFGVAAECRGKKIPFIYNVMRCVAISDFHDMFRYIDERNSHAAAFAWHCQPASQHVHPPRIQLQLPITEHINCCRFCWMSVAKKKTLCEKFVNLSLFWYCIGIIQSTDNSTSLILA